MARGTHRLERAAVRDEEQLYDIVDVWSRSVRHMACRPPGRWRTCSAGAVTSLVVGARTTSS